MELYEDKEHIISSDEYSEEDDDDDALMNDAIKAQSSLKVGLAFNERSVVNKPKWRIEQKNMQLSSLIRRNKISIIYKNKAIKWLNNKKLRERYKGHIFRTVQDSTKITDVSCTSETLRKVNKVHYTARETNNVVNIDDEDDRDADIETKVLGEEVLKSDRDEMSKQSKLCADAEDSGENIQLEERSILKQTHERNEKRGRTVEGDAEYLCQSEKKFKLDSPQFYKKINEMFPMFDEIANEHIDFTTNGTLSATEEKMKSIFNEIQTLNDIIRTKEMEWNRLIHLKMIKEEIYSRLLRKKHVLDLKETIMFTRQQSVLSELKELELFLSEKNTTPHANNSSIQQIIENRANMNTEDLRRESNNTSRLHSLLVSRNMLPNAESGNHQLCVNGAKEMKCNSAHINSSLDSYKQYDNKTMLSRGRQEEFKDVKNIIADFRQKNPKNLQRDNRTQQHSQYMHLPHDRKRGYYPIRSHTDQKLITPPAMRSKNMPFSQDLIYANSMNNCYGMNLDENYSKIKSKSDFEVGPSKGMLYPYCQECQIHKSRFVCAGCGNQWYCSKKCQISAWDKHSEICTE